MISRECEDDLIFVAKGLFSDEFWALVRKHLNMVPEEIEHVLRSELQDLTSVWHPGVPGREGDVPIMGTFSLWSPVNHQTPHHIDLEVQSPKYPARIAHVRSIDEMGNPVWMEGADDAPTALPSPPTEWRFPL